MFKLFVSNTQKTFGDKIYDGDDFAVLIDAVSVSRSPEESAEKIHDFCRENHNDFAACNPSQIAHKIHEYLLNIGGAACILVLQKCAGASAKNSVIIRYAHAGNLQIAQFKNGEKSFIIAPQNQPDFIAGVGNAGDFGTGLQVGEFALDPAATYIAASDGLDLSNTTEGDIEGVNSGKSGQLFGERFQNHNDDWCFVKFPYASADDGVFVGNQEGREHERRGLKELKAALSADPDFAPFHIVNGIGALKKFSDRESDGVLVCPFGVFWLELKDWHGEITIRANDARGASVTGGPDYNLKNTLDGVKILAGIRNSDQSPLFDTLGSGGVDERERSGALVVFTGTPLRLFVYDADGGQTCHLSKAVITAVSDAAKNIKKYKKLTGRLKHRLTPAQISEITEKLSELASPQNSEVILGDYTFSRSDLVREVGADSGGARVILYRLFKGQDGFGEVVAIKEFALTGMQGDAEKLAIGREKRIQNIKSKHIQGFYALESRGARLYSVLEWVEGEELGVFLQKNDLSLKERFSLILQFCEMLEGLENKGVTHRAINPQNIIINGDKTAVLCNFELCQNDILATITPAARTLLGGDYAAPELNTANSSDASGADAFSVGQLICLVLGGAPFWTLARFRTDNRRAGWGRAVAAKCGLRAEFAGDFERLLGINPDIRPRASELKNMIERWRQSVC